MLCPRIRAKMPQGETCQLETHLVNKMVTSWIYQYSSHENASRNEFLLDSGSSSHMSCEPGWMHNLHPIPSREIRLADNSIIHLRFWWFASLPPKWTLSSTRRPHFIYRNFGRRSVPRSNATAVDSYITSNSDYIRKTLNATAVDSYITLYFRIQPLYYQSEVLIKFWLPMWHHWRRLQRRLCTCHGDICYCARI